MGKMFCIQNRSLTLIVTFVVVVLTFFEYLNTSTDATLLNNEGTIHKLQSRSLVFPPTAPTRLQFIGGIGVPVEDLHFESVTSGYVLKAEYFLPETADEFRQKLKPQTIHRRRKNINETSMFDVNFDDPLFKKINNTFLRSPSKTKCEPKKNYIRPDNNFKRYQKHGASYRWLVYRAIEMILNRSSLNGHVCLLRSICEHSVIPLNYEGGLLAEILHILLTPSMSQDEHGKTNINLYLRAEIFGRSGKDCENLYSQCKTSPMGMISAVFET